MQQRKHFRSKLTSKVNLLKKDKRKQTGFLKNVSRSKVELMLYVHKKIKVVRMHLMLKNENINRNYPYNKKK